MAKVKSEIQQLDYNMGTGLGFALMMVLDVVLG